MVVTISGGASAQSIGRVMQDRALVVEAALQTANLAMEVAGGEGFLRKSGLERTFRDIQGARYHPMRSDKATLYAGTLALGGDVSHIY
jgi:alkylation response protein AidB-like acyl-CoA dehydrogenase